MPFGSIIVICIDFYRNRLTCYMLHLEFIDAIQIACVVPDASASGFDHDK